MTIQLICIQTYHAHWAGHSGYHHFLFHLGENFRIEHIRVPRGTVAGQGLKVFEKMIFIPFLRFAKGRINPWTTENDLLTELRLVQKVRKRLKGGGKVVVHFLDGEIGYNFFGALYRFLFRKPNHLRVIASYHQPGPILRKVLLHKERVKELDLVLTVGTNQFAFFDFLPKQKIRFVPHGIDTEYFRPPKKRPERIGQLYCLTVGHWLRDFNVLEKVARIAPRRLIFRIVAEKEHVERFRELKNVELYSGIEDDELLRLYQNSDIGLMPLEDSTANNGLLEMMACGLPIVTTRAGSVADYLPEQAGILIEMNEPLNILSAVKRLADSPEERKHLGEAARCRAIELNWSNIANQMAELYRTI